MQKWGAGPVEPPLAAVPEPAGQWPDPWQVWMLLQSSSSWWWCWPLLGIAGFELVEGFSQEIDCLCKNDLVGDLACLTPLRTNFRCMVPCGRFPGEGYSGGFLLPILHLPPSSQSLQTTGASLLASLLLSQVRGSHHCSWVSKWPRSPSLLACSHG